MNLDPSYKSSSVLYVETTRSRLRHLVWLRTLKLEVFLTLNSGFFRFIKGRGKNDSRTQQPHYLCLSGPKFRSEM